MRGILGAILLLSATAHADKWTARDTVMQAAYGATLAADYVQTRRAVREGLELNPIMGAQGERVAPEIYFPVTFAIHTVAMALTPKPYRNIVQGISLCISTSNVYRNYSMGWGFSW